MFLIWYNISRKLKKVWLTSGATYLTLNWKAFSEQTCLFWHSILKLVFTVKSIEAIKATLYVRKTSLNRDWIPHRALVGLGLQAAVMQSNMQYALHLITFKFSSIVFYSTPLSYYFS